MSISQWPCSPDKLTDFLDEELIRVILTGSSEKYQLPLAIFDKNGNNLICYNPINENQQTSPFCRCIRSFVREDDVPGICGIKARCREWVFKIASDTLNASAEEERPE